mmetsp:Transcript_17183/g.25399  ORF Transcript_17183/g.25399 Transcript_17183/m.25399 type:complete len:97 (-) Transcript_17183:1377-1667(-)
MPTTVIFEILPSKIICLDPPENRQEEPMHLSITLLDAILRGSNSSAKKSNSVLLQMLKIAKLVALVWLFIAEVRYSQSEIQKKTSDGAIDGSNEEM